MHEDLIKYKNEIAKTSYLETTKHTYFKYFFNFFTHFDCDVKNLDKLIIREYILNSGSVSVCKASITFYFEKVLLMTLQFPINSFNKTTYYEKLSQKQVISFLEECKDLKFKTIFSLAYYLGLTKSEILNIRVSDFSDTSITINYNPNKIRTLNLNIETSSLIKNCISIYKPTENLFIVYELYLYGYFNRIKKKLNLPSSLSMSNLKYSNIQHKYDDGESIENIMKFLGTTSFKSVMKYIKSDKCAILPELK